MIDHVQINDVTPIVHYLGDGVQAAFTFPFAVFKTGDLEVWVDNVRAVAGYTVSGAGISSGGAVLFAVPPAQGAVVTLRRRITLARVTDFQSDGIIRAKTLNDELDYQVAAVQQVAEDVARCVRRRFTSASAADLTLPDPVGSRALKWNATGDALVNSDTDPDAAVQQTTARANAAALSAQDAAASAATAHGYADAAGQHSVAAGVSAHDAAASAAAAASLVAAVTLPSAAGNALGYLRQKTGEDGLEYRTPVQVLADIGGQSAADTKAQLEAGIGQLRDQGVLTALRQMLNTSVGTGALVRGREWELSTDEWGGTSTGHIFVNGALGYYTNGFGADLTVPGGTAYSSEGSAASAFDNSTSTMCSFAAGTPGTIDYDFVVPRRVDRVRFLWRDASGAGQTVRIHSSSDRLTWTLRAEAVIPQDDTTTWRVIDVPGGATARHWRWNQISVVSGTYGGAREVEYLARSPMVLGVPAAVTVNSAPTYADLYFLWKDDSGTGLTAPAGTARLSRDGGVTKTVAALSVVAAFDATYSIVRARADVSGQPSGTSLWADVDFGAAVQRFAAPALLGE